MRLASGFAWLLSFALCVPCSASDRPVRPSYSFQPDRFTGRSTAAIPFAVPPGRLGMQPSLALAYSSSAQNGSVGVGWTLELGSIERSLKNGSPKYDGSDVYTLTFGGSTTELVQISDGSYRLKDEGAFLRVVPLSPGWEVTDPNGTRYRYGQTGLSQVEAAGQVFRWNLDEIIDVHGNRLTMVYVRDQGQSYPSEITYLSNHVVFIWEGRPDVLTDYRSGFGVTTAKRLKTLETYAGSALARRYSLTYTTSPRTTRSLLASVTEIGTDGTTAYPPTRFTYTDGAVLYSPLSVTFPANQAVLSADVNGDASADLITWEANTGSWQVRLGTTEGFGNPTVWLTGFGTTGAIPLVSDWNADGRSDVGLYQGGGWRFALSDGSKFIVGGLPDLSFGNGSPFVGDFTGDQRPDVGTFDGAGRQVAVNTGTGFAPSSSLSRTYWGGPQDDVVGGDFNGDGLTDLALWHRVTGEVQVSLSDGTRISDGVIWLRNAGINKPRSSADVNGDGLTDMVYFDPAIAKAFVCYSDGAKFSDPIQLAPNLGSEAVIPMDSNGDNLTDFFAFNPQIGTAQLARSQGPIPDLLSQMTTPLGGTTTITYTLSTRAQTDLLPFVIPLVQEVADGQDVAERTSYRYAQGKYDPISREFRGFGTVESRDAIGTMTRTTFAQDNVQRGRLLTSELVDTRTVNTWTTTTPNPGVSLVALTQVEESVGSKTTRRLITYDSYGNVTRLDEHGDVSVSGDERALVMSYYPNVTAWILRKPALMQRLNATGGIMAQDRYYYDWATRTDLPPVKGDCTKQERWLNRMVDSNGNTFSANRWLSTTMTYEPTTGNLLTITDALNQTTRNTYDASGTFLIQVTNHLNQTRKLTSDPRDGALLTETDANNLKTTTQYDALGRVTAVIGPTDTATKPTTWTSYDLAQRKTLTCQRITSGQDAATCTASYTDTLGRVRQVRREAESPGRQIVSGTVAYEPRGLVVTRWASYDAAASETYVPMEQEASNVPSQTLTYDALERLTTTTETDEATSRVDYQDWTTTRTDANGHVIKQTSDAYGHVVQIEEILNGQTATTKYIYDSLDQLVQVINAVGHKVSLTYDSLGRKLVLSDPDMGRWAWAYDDVGNVLRQHDPRGVVQTSIYDALNRVKQTSWTVPPSSTIPVPAPVSYRYDEGTYAKNHLTYVGDSQSTRVLNYDALGRVTKQVQTRESVPYTTQWRYDLLNRLTSLTYPTGEVASYRYSPQRTLDSVTLRLTDGRVFTVASFDVNAQDQVSKTVYGNGVTTLSSYEPKRGWLTGLDSRTKSGVLLQDLRYGFDPVGNNLSVQDAVGTATQAFTYDELNRLSTASGSYGSQRYVYDVIGNLREKDGVVQAYSRSHALTWTSAGVRVSYDAAGHAITKTTPTESRRMDYDAANRLVKVVRTAPAPETVLVSYRYDGEGNVLDQTTAEDTTRFHGELAEVGASGTTISILAQGRRLATRTTDFRYYLPDALGSTHLVTDSKAVVVERLEYWPFGGIAVRVGPVDVPHTFTGHRTQPPTGWLRMGPRFYDASLGRFLQPDSVIPGGNPQALNRYSYCLNNPTSRVDPSGHWSFKKFFNVIRAAFFAVASLAVAVVLPGGQPLAAFATAAFAKTAVVSAVAAATSTAVLDTGEGRQFQRQLAQQVFDEALGMRPRTAARAASVVSHAALSWGVEQAGSRLLLAPGRASDKVVIGSDANIGAGRSLQQVAADGGTVRSLIGPGGDVYTYGFAAKRGFLGVLPMPKGWESATSVNQIGWQHVASGGQEFLFTGSARLLHGTLKGLCVNEANLAAAYKGLSFTASQASGATYTTFLSEAVYGIYGNQLPNTITHGLEDE